MKSAPGVRFGYTPTRNIGHRLSVTVFACSVERGDDAVQTNRSGNKTGESVGLWLVSPKRTPTVNMNTLSRWTSCLSLRVIMPVSKITRT